MKAALVMSITLIFWRVVLTVDITVINSLQPFYVTKAAEAGEVQKDIYHEDKVLAAGGLFSPGGEIWGAGLHEH